jgi:uncharacterized membrane protein
MWKKAVFGTVSAGFVGYVVWVSCLSPARHQVEWDVATRVTAVLERTGFSKVVPVVDGRDERIVSMVRGVRVVDANMLVSGDEGLGGGET